MKNVWQYDIVIDCIFEIEVKINVQRYLSCKLKRTYYSWEMVIKISSFYYYFYPILCHVLLLLLSVPFSRLWIRSQRSYYNFFEFCCLMWFLFSFRKLLECTLLNFSVYKGFENYEQKSKHIKHILFPLHIN